MIDGLSSPYVIKYESGTPTPEMLRQFEVFGSGTVTFRQGLVKSLGLYNDTSPFYGGSNVVASNTGLRIPCTSGFAGKGIDRKYYLTMAWHCVKFSDPRAWISNGTYIGPITQSFSVGYDTALINASANGKYTYRRIFHGGNGFDSQTKLVVGIGGHVQGLMVCSSGSYIRAVCDARMGTKAVYLAQNLYSGGHAEVPVYSVERISNNAIVTEGDSGGPVFTNTNNNTQAIGRGTISGGYSSIGCPAYVGSGHICYRNAVVVDLTRIATAFDLNFSSFALT